MARQARSLLGVSALAGAADAPEAVLLECHLRADGPGVDDFAVVRCATVLVHFCRDVRQRALLPSVVAGMAEGRSRRLQGLDSILDGVLSLECDILNAVVVLPEVGGLEGAAVSVADAIGIQSGRCSGIVMGVASDPRRWSGLRGMDGFVAALPSDLVAAGGGAFRVLAALQAPGLLTCGDEDEVLEALGSAEEPSRVVQALWRSKERRLEFFHEAERRTVEASAAVFGTPVHPYVSLAEARSVAAAIRHEALRSSTVGLIVSAGFFLPSPFGDLAWPVCLLCR